MPINDPNNPLDLRYINTDGDAMGGPLLLETPASDLAAVTKIYVDRLLASISGPMPGLLRRDGSLPMTGPLTLSGAPTNADHAARRAYVDAVMTYAQALAAAMLRHDGTVPMTGLLRLSGAPVNALDAATRGYVDAADALMVLVDGTRAMTGALTLPGLPVNPLEAATKSYVDALPVGLSTYDAVVAAAGADYTTVVAACATEAAGARIFIKRGTYNEAADIVMKDGQMLIGENPEDTIIDFGAANRKITFAGASTNLAVVNLTVQNSIADRTIDLTGDYALVENCRVIGTVNDQVGVYFAGTHCWLKDNYITGFTGLNQQSAWVGNYTKITGNSFVSGSIGLRTGTDCSIVGNTFLTMAAVQAYIARRTLAEANIFYGGTPIRIFGQECSLVGNVINGATGVIWNGAFDYITITGNFFDGSQVDCTDVGVSDCTITGNIFKAGGGVSWVGDQSVISGNVFQGTAFINLTAAATENSITGNNLQNSTAVPKIVDAGAANLAKNNAGVDSRSEKDFRTMENTSGGPLVAGDCVVLKAVAAGDEVTTTVAQGDDLVFGMLDENIANAAYGAIQTEGFTAKLKVNGTVAIGIGDLIGTFTAAGIAMKAAAGDMAFAIALEAYAVADSNGVIDAILIKPRKV